MRPLPTRKLNKRITRVWRLSAIINLVLLALISIGPYGLVVAALWSDSSINDAAKALLLLILWILLMCLAVLFVILVVIVPKVRWIQWSFEVYDQEIDIHKGIFWRKRIIIPLIRVQNVDTRQGPIMRANGLASFTAATAAGEHEIPGLDVAEADALRDHVALLARIAQEDV